MSEAMREEPPLAMVIVEVLSPSTQGHDRAWKLGAYFRLPAVHHYLIVWPEKRQIAHHRRGGGDAIDSKIVTKGAIQLDPPGVTITIEEVYD
jgi:Uma2 family endonuclease